MAASSLFKASSQASSFSPLTCVSVIACLSLTVVVLPPSYKARVITSRSHSDDPSPSPHLKTLKSIPFAKFLLPRKVTWSPFLGMRPWAHSGHVSKPSMVKVLLILASEYAIHVGGETENIAGSRALRNRALSQCLHGAGWVFACCPPKITCGSPNPRCDDTKRWGLYEVLGVRWGHGGQASRWESRAYKRRKAPQSSPHGDLRARTADGSGPWTSSLQNGEEATSAAYDPGLGSDGGPRSRRRSICRGKASRRAPSLLPVPCPGACC